MRRSQAVVPTVVIVCGVLLTAISLPSDGAVDIFAHAAIGVGLSLMLATGLEAKFGVRGLIRADLVMLWILYGLTFLEFLFPQPGVEGTIVSEAARLGVFAVMLGLVGIGVGRHLVSPTPHSLRMRDFYPGHIFSFFLLAGFIGYLHILLAVNFDLLEMIRQMSLPRFSQSWGRGRYGDIYSLLYELGLLIYLLPPVAGLIFARGEQFSVFQKVVVSLVLGITFYYAFASGTRNILGTYVIAFFGAYFLSKPDLNLAKAAMIGVPVLLLVAIATTLMLEFRGSGIEQIFSKQDYHYDTLFIDQNIVNLSKLTQVFPDTYAYLGFEIPYQALIKPIPRAIWPGKPEGLSVSIEAALGSFDQVTTLSSTFVGEAYMAAGLFGVALAGLLFGLGAELWNRVGRSTNSSFSQILYASGFLCAAMAMRSMLTMVPFMLPSLALWLYGKYWLSDSLANSSPSRSWGDRG